MRLIGLPFKIIIGVTLFILLIGAYYSTTIINTSSKSKIQYGEKIYNGKFITPVENFITVTSKYRYRAPVYNSQGVQISGGKKHTGIDICGSIGSNVLCVKYGEVTWAGWQKGYGNCVEVRHIGDDGNIFYTFYAHMRDNSICVEQGQIVEEGQVIGIQGSTGNSTGDHLHFEIRLKDKSTIDPAPYLFDRREKI